MVGGIMQEEKAKNSEWPPWTSNLLTPSLVEKIKSNARLKKFQKGGTIYNEGGFGDKMYLLTKGRVEISIFAVDGRKKIVAIHEPYCLFGEMALDGSPYVAGAEAMCEVEVFIIDSKKFLEMVASDTNLLQALLRTMILKMRTLGWQISQQSFNDVGQRTENLLNALASNFGQTQKEGIILELPLTHQLIAELIGSSRVRVSQKIGELYQQKKFTKIKRKFIFPPDFR